MLLASNESFLFSLGRKNDKVASISVFDLRSGEILEELELESSVKAVRKVVCSQKYLVLATDPKLLIIYNIEKLADSAKRVLTLIKSVTPMKTITSCFISDDILIFSDKFGDVFSIGLDDHQNCQKEQAPPKLLLGQVSMITDVLVAHLKDRKLLITCDRDERIKCCYYPQCHVIKDFLLGHESYVSRMTLLGNFLVSGGGDNYLNVWDLSKQGGSSRKITLASVEKPLDIFEIIPCQREGNFVYVLEEKKPFIYVVKVDDGQVVPIELPHLVLAACLVQGSDQQSDSFLLLTLENGDCYTHKIGDKSAVPLLESSSFPPAKNLQAKHSVETILSSYPHRNVADLRKKFFESSIGDHKKASKRKAQEADEDLEEQEEEEEEEEV